MPRQAADGEAQNAPLLFKPGTFQPMAQDRFARSHRLFQRLRRLRGRQLALPPQRAGGMHVQLIEAPVICRQSLRGKMAAAVSEGQAVALHQLVPVSLLDPLRQNPVEYQTARGGQQPRTSSPRRRQTAALGPVARLIDITAIPTKTLGA